MQFDVIYSFLLQCNINKFVVYFRRKKTFTRKQRDIYVTFISPLWPDCVWPEMYVRCMSKKEDESDETMQRFKKWRCWYVMRCGNIFMYVHKNMRERMQHKQTEKSWFYFYLLLLNFTFTIYILIDWRMRFTHFF